MSDIKPVIAPEELKYTCTTKGCENPTHGLKCKDCLEGRGPKPTKTSPTDVINGGAAAQAKRKKSPLDLPEAEIRIAIKAWYRLQGAKVWDTEQEMHARIDPGVSDLIITRGRGKAVLFAEIKSATGVQSKEQKEFEAAVKACGAEYVIMRSLQEAIDYEEVRL